MWADVVVCVVGGACGGVCGPVPPAMFLAFNVGRTEVPGCDIVPVLDEAPEVTGFTAIVCTVTFGGAVIERMCGGSLAIVFPLPGKPCASVPLCVIGSGALEEKNVTRLVRSATWGGAFPRCDCTEILTS